MSWAKVDDGWHSHIKVGGLSLAARGLWITALSWSCHQRSQFVPLHFVMKETGGSKVEANELASVGLWDETDGGWVIHDWCDYQGQSVSEKRAEAGRKGGLRSRPPKQTEANVGSKAEAKPEAGPSRPFPSLPDPKEQQHPQPTPATATAPVDDNDLKQRTTTAIAEWAEQVTARAANVSNPAGLAAHLRAKARTDGTLEAIRALVAAGSTATEAATAHRLAASRTRDPSVDLDPSGREAARQREQATMDRNDARRALVPADAHVGAAAARKALKHEQAS